MCVCVCGWGGGGVGGGEVGIGGEVSHAKKLNKAEIKSAVTDTRVKTVGN